MNISDLINESHNTAKSKGWWEEERELGTQIALMHSELSEALEEWRVHGFDPDKYIYQNDSGKYEGMVVELADCLIRIFDTCGHYNLPLEKALRLKMDYNKTRPHRHGGKLA